MSRLIKFYCIFTQFILLLPAFLINSVYAQSLEEDSLALLVFFDSTNGQSWTNRANWRTESALSTWHGVTIAEGRVSELKLANNNVTGFIPSALGNITELTKLVLFNNKINGTIPFDIGNLQKLQTLFLSTNQITGDLPPSIGSLASLKLLYLGNNQLTGSLPPELGNLANLTSLILSKNNLSGSIPGELGNISQLKNLSLDNNQLSGSIPPELGNLLNLEKMYLNFNQLSGPIPPELSRLDNLIDLYLSENNLSGPIPIELSNLTNLKNLYLTTNQLTGSIPPELSQLANLSRLYLGSNQLRGNIPGELGTMDSLSWLNLGINQLSGAVPATFLNSNKIASLIFSSNNLSEMPDLSSSTTITSLNIADNQFTFEDIEPNIGISNFTFAPQDSVGTAENIKLMENDPLTLSVNVGGTANQYQWSRNGIDIPGATSSTFVINNVTPADSGLYSCAITNAIVTGLTIYRQPTKVTVIPLGSVQDSLALISLYDNTNGPHWLTNTNWRTSQPLSTWFGITVTSYRVTRIDLAGNNLVGFIPNSIGECSELKTLNLAHNLLADTLPESIINAINIDSLVIDSNQFVHLPDLNSLSNLSVLHVGHNRLTFEDIEPNISITDFIYSPQDSVDTARVVILPEDSTLELTVEVGGSANLYQWVKNGIEISGATEKTLIINGLGQSDDGVYSCKITNSICTSLTLYSRPVTVTVIPLQFIKDSLALIALFDSTAGPQWINKLNWRSPYPLATWFGITVENRQVTQINLRDNGLKGAIPNDLGNMKGLKILNLSHNWLYGNLPSVLGNCLVLEQVDLSSNSLQGTIPLELSTLALLKVLHLGNNQLSGDIPKAFKNLNEMRNLYLFNNKFTSLPDLSNIDSFNLLHVFDNRLTFEHIEPNIKIPGFVYAPQDSIGVARDTIVALGSKVSLSATIKGTANRYQWIKDGVIIPGAKKSRLTIRRMSINDTGSYICQIDNDIASQLTLYTRPIRLRVDNSVVIKPRPPYKYLKKLFALAPNPVTTKHKFVRIIIPKFSNSKTSLRITNALNKTVFYTRLPPSYHGKTNKRVNIFKWNLRTSRNRRIKPGMYCVILTIQGAHGTKTMKRILAVKR